MPDDASLNSAFDEAVARFWAARESAADRQRATGSADRGNRQAVTSGGHLDGFLDTITEALVSNGVATREEVRRGRRLPVLPGFFRPEKEWDLIVMRGARLGAVVELKAQVGPSFGNNFNNRAEEALGNADDLWTAYREGAFGGQPAPWLGFLFLLEDHPESRRSVRVFEPLFRVFPEFRSTSYAQRYELLLRKMVLERRYSAACLLLSPRPSPGVAATVVEPASDLTSRAWLRSMIAHLSGF
jgi:hypothetical protein